MNHHSPRKTTELHTYWVISILLLLLLDDMSSEGAIFLDITLFQDTTFVKRKKRQKQKNLPRKFKLFNYEYAINFREAQMQEVWYDIFCSASNSSLINCDTWYLSLRGLRNAYLSYLHKNVKQCYHMIVPNKSSVHKGLLNTVWSQWSR